MSENLMCSAHKFNSKEFRDNFDTIFKKPKEKFSVLCPYCRIFYDVNDLNYHPIDKTYHCPKCGYGIYKKEFGGGTG